MKKKLFTSCMLLAAVGLASAQQVNTSNSASVSGTNTVSADKSGANVQSDNKINASSQTSVSGPTHNFGKNAKAAEHSGGARHEKNNSLNATDSLAAGTTVNAVLAKPIDSQKCKPGDQVVATAAQDVKSDGKVVIQKGSKLVGHVTQAESKGKGEANSSLGMVFDHAVLKNGQEVQINSVVQAIAASRVNAAPVGDDAFAETGSAAGMAHSGTAAGGGLLGGVASTATSTTGTVSNVGGGATGAVTSTVGSTANVGNGLSNSLNSNTSGVVGLKGLSLATDASNATQGSVITSTGKSVHLDGGTQMMLRVVK
jgi:hypothetical protein